LIDVVQTRSIRSKGDPAAVGRPDRKDVDGRLERESRRDAPRKIVKPEVHKVRLTVEQSEHEPLTVTRKAWVIVAGDRSERLDLSAGAVEPEHLRRVRLHPRLVGEDAVVRHGERSR